MIHVHPSGRWLSRDDGAPFFWLGDTAWELFHRLRAEEAEAYLRARATQGFTVIQAVALAEFDGLHTPNAYGECPLLDDDPARPNPAYFAFVDRVVDLAASLGLVVALLPTWGDKVNRNAWGTGPVVFDPENARRYGLWLGQRYRDRRHLVWILGGDRPPDHQGVDYRPVWRALAAGLDEGQGRRTLKAYHPSGRQTTVPWLHEEPWLDLHMQQSGHGSRDAALAWEGIAEGWARTPPKPVLDAEPNYEDHPVNPWPNWDPANGYFDDYDVRRQLYRSVFAGGCGVTYGHHSVWQFCGERHPPHNHARMDWREALTRPGALQVGHLRRMLEARPAVGREPDMALVRSDAGVGVTRVGATRDAAGAWGLVYLPTAAPVTLDLGRLAGRAVHAAWIDPRDGRPHPIGRVPAHGEREFVPPSDSGPDWVLALDAER